MSLPGRTNRRGGGGGAFRWVAIGVVITLLVLLIDASLQSKSPSIQQSMTAGRWVDGVLPAITSSNEEGRVLESLWSSGLHMPASSVASTVDSVAAGAAKNYTMVVSLRPPADLSGPAGLLEAALLARSKAAANLDKAFRSTLGSAVVAPGTKVTATTPPTAMDPTTVLPTVSAAGSEIQVGDQAYQLFLSSVPPSLGVPMPKSVWGANPAPYAPAAAGTYLAALQSAAVTTPVYKVKIAGITTTPAPVSSNGAVQVLPDASSITLNVVVADVGNQPLNNLTVTAAIAPAGQGSSTVRDFVSLEVGQAYTISALGPLNPPQGVPVTLTVSVAPSSGASLAPVSSSLTFQMPAPAPPASSTTTTAPASKTTPTT